MQQPPSPRLTIAIPTLNRAHCLARAIDSALSQVNADIEIIVSDNGSCDDTADVIARYDDPRLRKFQHEITMSPQAHGNFLLEAARGEFFLGLSDDDYIDPDFAQRAIALYERVPGLSFVYTATILHIADVELPALHGPEVEDSLHFIAAFFGNLRNVCWCACVTRLADLRAIGSIPPDRFIGDMYYWCKIAFQGPVGCVHRPVSHYTFMTADNMTSSIGVLRWAHEVQCLADESLELFVARNPDGNILDSLRHSMARFIALSVADQFVWTAIRGAPKTGLALTALKAYRYCWRHPVTWPRIAASLTVPRGILRRLVLLKAAKAAEGHERIIRNWQRHLL
ncbi:MAG: glycosyltransferase family 2 protein [Sulfuritalea sp.]|nr:glycosyltransferase family 2 protein [Sulfuritalea sp.]